MTKCVFQKTKCGAVWQCLGYLPTKPGLCSDVCGIVWFSITSQCGRGCIVWYGITIKCIVWFVITTNCIVLMWYHYTVWYIMFSSVV